MERLIRFFNFLDPHIQRIKFLLNQVIEVIRSIENSINRSHQKRKESEPQKLQANGENIFIRSMASVISISNCCDYLEYPIKSKNISWVIWFWVKAIVINPTFDADNSCICTFWTVFLHPKSQPHARHNVTNVYHIKNKSRESN